MQNALCFFSPDEELENLKALARGEYEESCAATANTNRYPAVEEMFPELCELVQQLGQQVREPIVFSPDSEAFRDAQLAKLSHYTAAVFASVPQAAHRLVSRSPALFAPTATAPAIRESTLPVPTSTAPAARPVSALKPQIPQTEPAQIAAAKEPGKDVAYEVTQTLLQVESIQMLGEALHHYTGKYFRYITSEDMRRIIMSRCRSAVEREGNGRLVDAVFKLLLCEPKICSSRSGIDTNIVSLQNGVLNLQTGQFYQHSPGFNTFYMITGNYGSPIPHPVFDRVLADITGGDQLLARRIMEVIGYCLVPDTRGKVFFVFQGVPDSGKSLLASFIRECLNEEATAAPDLLSLGDRFSASVLIGKQLCLTMDLPSAPLSAKTVSAFKTLTGGDLLTADIKYRAPVTFRNTAKFILGTNHPLRTQYTDPAFLRRAIAVPFTNSIPRERMDINLLSKLLAEKDAIINHALKAYCGLRSNNYRFSGDFRVIVAFGDSTTAQVMGASTEDFLVEFVRSSCEIGKEGEAFVDDLYHAFVSQFGESAIPSTQFSARLLEVCQNLELAVHRGPGSGKKRRPGAASPTAYLTGISLKEPIPVGDQ